MQQNGTHKRWELEDLAKEFDKLRAQNKKIVHCHGVFDLLHIGHIRHLKKAKSFGDVLVVTLTPDRYVNKGPHRPAFSEELRADAIAALDCVDYVAINKWPMADETIRLIRPHFYVKGSDYKDAQQDVTGGIAIEEAMLKSVGGRLLITEELTFSSSSLINRHLPVLPPEASAYLVGFIQRYTSDQVYRYLDGAKALKVLVVGESIIDEYQYCEAIGKSTKEPMLAVKALENEKFAGGILAVANNAANFCDRVGVITFLGTQNRQEDFIRERLHPNIEPTFLSQTNSPTIVKRRFIESYFFTKLMEIYEINDGTLDKKDNETLCAVLNEQVPQYDLVIVVDFGHSMLGKEAIEILCKEARFLAVNAQSNAGNRGYHSIQRYPRMDYACLAENEVRMEVRDRRGDIRDVARTIIEEMGLTRLVITRGKTGCLCYSAQEGFVEIPSLTTNIIDRMGAGDAFFSISALCVAQNAPMEVAGFIGNVVGAKAVATVGHRSAIGRIPLMKHIESLMK